MLSAQMKEDIREEIEKIIYYDTDVLQKEIPGFSIALLYQDSVFTFHYGYTSFAQKQKLEDSTIFEIGGLTKVFTASLIEVLVQDGLLEYDKPFNSYLDSIHRNASLNHITIADLVCHRAGLPKLPSEFGIKEKEPNNPYAYYTKEDLLNFYKNYTPDEEKRKYFYSSLNYALLEIAIENVSRKNYESILKEKILTPLTLQETFIRLDQKSGKMPVPGFSIGKNQMPVLKFQSFSASEGLKTTIRDLVRFLRVNMGALEASYSKIFENIHQPVYETEINKYAKVAKGWHVVELKKYYNVILHSGSTNGHRAYIGFVKETQTGVVVLSNSEHSMDGLGFLILRMLNHNWKKKKSKKKR